MIYLDCAATSFQKPHAVRNAVSRAILTMSSPGRGGYPAAMRAADTCYACRELAGEMFSCEPESVVFTFNATHGLNIAINSLVKAGDRVVISGYEHNAVTRPLHALKADIKVAGGSLFDREEILQNFSRLLPDAKCCVCTHVSNVFGYILPMDEIAELCRKHNVPLIVDASQSAGVLPLNMKKWNCAFIAMPGHKGLMGLQGTGLLLCNHDVAPIICGGTGSASIEQDMPSVLPDRLEAGTHNVPGIAGLLAGMRYVHSLSPERIARHEVQLRRLLASEIKKNRGVIVLDSDDNSLQTGVLSVRFDTLDSEEMASLLAERGVAVRGGLHCAPLAHKSAGTVDSGTVRFSFSPMNNKAEIMRTSQIIKDILNKT